MLSPRDETSPIFDRERWRLFERSIIVRDLAGPGPFDDGSHPKMIPSPSGHSSSSSRGSPIVI
jgi:hypothetical protein